MYTILIIEDDEAICRELQMLLQKQGYEAICWNMQEDIRELVKTHDPHIILWISICRRWTALQFVLSFAAFPRFLLYL